MWDPEQYLRHADDRVRPFHDLLARIPNPGPDPTPDSVQARDSTADSAPGRAPGRVLDLGCGPGNATVELSDRWPDAHVTGFDNSPEMIEAARTRARPGRLDFRLADLATDEWLPEGSAGGGGVDVMVTNAALHWVPGHLARLARWTDTLNPGGSFAVQIPGNFDAPTHVLLRELIASARWKDRLTHPWPQPEVSSADQYLDALARPGFRVDAWETTYRHILHGPDPVLSWVKGTALRPVLTTLSGTESDEFLAEYGALLADAYPARDFGTVLPFRRIFAVAVRDA